MKYNLKNNEGFNLIKGSNTLDAYDILNKLKPYVDRLIDKCDEMYLTLEAIDDCEFTFEIQADTANYALGVKSVSYSIDDGATWVTTNRTPGSATTITTPSVAANTKVLWKGDCPNGRYSSSNSTGPSSYFESTGRFSVSGDITSLIYNGKLTEIATPIVCRTLFMYCDNLISAKNLMLPATILVDYCYQSMFQDCTSLTDAPVLPATTLAEGCYDNMFNGCTSLTTAPELPATTLADYCYHLMFGTCTSLTTAPELPATTLTENCYFSMFADCTSLTTAPELPATTLITGCYETMFNGCSNLSYVKAMFTTDPSNTLYTNAWLSNVSQTGTFVKNSAATWTLTGISGIPVGWTVQTSNA